MSYPQHALTIDHRLKGEDTKRRPALAFWAGEQRRFAWVLTISLIALTVVQVSVPVALNMWSQRLFDALEQHDFANVLRQAGVAVLIIIGNVVVMTIHLKTKRRLQVEWRADLTRRLLDQWMVQGRDYRLSQLRGELDNPDGRIAEDVRIATEYSVDLAHSSLYCALLLVSFAQILYGLSGPPQVQFGSWQFTLPGHLVWIAMAYAGAGAVVATWLGQPLTRAATLRQNKEADFRSGLVRARETALTIPLVNAGSMRPKNIKAQFAKVVGAWQRQSGALAHLVMFSSSWTVLSQAVPILVAAPRYVAGAITLGVLMQTVQAFQQMISALSWPIDNMQKLAECRASLARVAHLHASLIDLTDTSDKRHGVAAADGDGPTLETVESLRDASIGEARVGRAGAVVASRG